MTSTTSRTATPHRPRGKRLKLNRSKHHKITFELRGVNVDLVAFPPDSGETENSVDVRIHDLDIFDHVPTSTWKKFAMYDQDAGEREMDANMVHLEILNTKPVADVAASEMVIKVKVLPLRLHVDQDALDFITRFFEFKDDSTPIHASPSDVPFIQRIEIHDIPVALDFKPKRVDYAGLRSGHTTEFMNFMILEESRMVLRHVILYGVSGFDKMGKELNSIWMDNIKRTQLPGILAGLAPVRSLVNAGSGFKDLVEIPIREYRKDGRIVRSIGKGVGAFAKTTGTEVVKLGAKLAIGTQYALQGAEGILVKGSGAHGEGSSTAGEFGEDEFPEEKKQISLYAEQPMGIIQGVRGAYASLARDLSVARDAIIAVPAEIMESTSAQGAAKAVLKRAPTIIFRPAIGATKAIGQTLLGATNSLDPENRRRMEAVSRPWPYLYALRPFSWLTKTNRNTRNTRRSYEPPMRTIGLRQQPYFKISPLEHFPSQMDPCSRTARQLHLEPPAEGTDLGTYLAVLVPHRDGLPSFHYLHFLFDTFSLISITDTCTLAWRWPIIRETNLHLERGAGGLSCLQYLSPQPIHTQLLS